MSKIAFFSIPAHGHINPTIPVVAELVKRGHQVWYYSFLEFQEKIEAAGARFIACDEYLPQISQKELDRKAGKDLDRKSTRLNSSHVSISYAVFCLKKKRDNK